MKKMEEKGKVNNNNSEDKLNKKERLKVVYISVYVLIIISLLVYGMTYPEFLEQVDKLINTLYKAFDIF